MQVVIPFSGFYGTTHEMQLDDALEQLCQDQSGDPRPELEDIWEHVDWGVVRANYAAEYVRRLKKMFPVLSGLTFTVVESPREYNFTNDLLLGELTNPAEVLAACDLDTLRGLVKDNFTPCSGFIPYYSASWDDEDWQRPFEDWSPVQFKILLEAAMRSSDTWDADDLLPWNMFEGNVFVEDTIYFALPPEHQLRLAQEDTDA